MWAVGSQGKKGTRCEEDSDLRDAADDGGMLDTAEETPDEAGSDHEDR